MFLNLHDHIYLYKEDAVAYLIYHIRNIIYRKEIFLVISLNVEGVVNNI